jgi:nitrogen fixation NifU-like protein
MYSKKVLNRFKNPKNVGKLTDANAVGKVGNIKCGDMMKIYLKIDKNIIKDAKVETYGCVSAIAASDALCDLIKGNTLEEAQKMKYKEIIDELGELPKLKYHCSIMSTEALQKAIKNYLEKHNPKEEKIMFNEKSTLKQVLEHKNGAELLAKYHVPCLGCSFAQYELEYLKLKDIENAYGINLKGLLKDLNSIKIKKEIAKKQEIKKKINAKKTLQKSIKKTVTKIKSKTKKSKK